MCMGSYLTRWAKTWHIQQNYYWIWVCWTGRFPAELRLLHQRVTGWLHYTYHEARLCLNSQAGQWNMGMHYLDSLVHVFQKMWFHPAPSLYTVVFLSINTLLHFHDHCLSQLSFPTVFANFQTAFLQEHVNFQITYCNSIHAETLKCTVATYKHCIFSKGCVLCPRYFALCNLGTSNWLLPFLTGT